MAELSINKDKAALLVMDIQNDQVRLVQQSWPQRGDLPKRIRRVVDRARQVGMPVIYVVARFRKGHPEAHPRNKFQMSNKKLGRLVEGSVDAQVHADVAPLPDELVVVKRRVNAFYNTDLSTVLGALGIETLVLAGIGTSGVVLSTTRYAADADYDLIILEDLCGDRSAEVHNFLIEKILPFQATIASSEDFLKAVKAA